MKAIVSRVMAGAFALMVAAPMTAHAQGLPPVYPPGAAVPPPPQAPPGAPVFTPPQLDQMLAPIALYPDTLLSQILIASTYPLEVVEASRWLQNPGNAALRGDALAAAAEQQPWDPSVKSLLPFPQIIQMMDTRLDWMQQLGDAFLAQQPDVMNAIQRLRQEAQASGTLQSTPQQTVTTAGPAIVIVPANPEVVYVPVYNPTVVYGAWPYPSYPPYYIVPPGYATATPFAAGIAFGVGFAVVGSLWHWSDWDWREHRVDIDRDRFNRIDRDRHPVNTTVWHHEPEHRHGVPYGDTNSHAQFRTTQNPPSSRQDFRGFTPPASRQPVQPATAAPRPAAPPPAAQRPIPPTAFERHANGGDARAQAERGRASRQAIAAPPARPAPAPRPAAPPPAHGGNNRNERGGETHGDKDHR